MALVRDHAGDPRTVDTVARVVAEARTRDGQDPVDEATHRRLDAAGLAASEVWLAGGDGFAVRHDGALDLVVRPEARGRGLGTELARAALAAPGPLAAWSHGDHPAARALGAATAMAPDRSLWVLRRALAEPPLAPVVVPDGVALRSFTGGLDGTDARELLRVNAAAFAHHPEQGAMDAADLAARTAEPWWDPAGLILAVDERDGGLLGFHWTKRPAPGVGEVYVVGVDPSAQGRGLGPVLTLAGLHHLADGGAREVLLYVESDNEPALRVYQRLGFTHAAQDTHVQYHRPQ